MTVLVAMSLGVVMSATATATPVTQRVPLSLDRSDRGNSNAAWDEVQGVLRQKRSHSDARFATSGSVLGPTGVTGNANCGGSTFGSATVVNRALITPDIDGDGLRDIVVGCPGTGAVAGRVLLVRRATGNVGWDAPQWLAGLPNVASDKCGQSIDAGDFDADGKVDLIVGCPTLNVTGANSGGVLTFRRTSVNVGYDAPVQQVTAGGGGKVAIAASETCGAGVAAGDIDHDGDADIVFGCQSYSTDRGRVIVQTGSGAQTALYGTGTGAGNYTHQCGGTVVVADVNGDSDGDIVIGCHGSVVGGGWGGALLVYNSDGVGGYAAVPIKLDRGGSAGSNQYCGRSVAVGDLDGDGRADIAAGCSGADRILVFWNPPSPGTYGAFASAAITTLTPPISGQCGAGVTIGDATGDGRNDLAAGCPTYSSNRGASLVWPRLADGSAFATTPTQYDRPSTPTNSTCGQTIAIGDVDRDGRGQLVMGCGTDDAYTTGSDNGAVVVTAGTISARVVQSASPGSSDGCGLSTASGDFNGDGIGDVATGCWTRGGTEQGRVSVLTRASGDQFLGAAVDLVHPSPNSYDKCGHDVAVADFNGDGYDDLVMGCPGDRANGNQSGSFVVFERNGTGTAFLAGIEYILPGMAANDQCGWSVAAGDINRDGRADIAVGCIDDELGTTDTGLVAIYLRADSNAGFEAPDRYTRAGGATNDQCGSSVAIGDVDGDGDGDLVFGCSNASAGIGGVSVHLFDMASETFDTGSFVSGGATADWCGNDVALGDVDGNGRADLFVGCYGAGGATRSGGAFVATRNVANNGFDSPTWITDATAGTNEYCGAGVALGDTDGDGLDDVAMGCPFIGTTATAGSVVLATRNAANNGFDGAIVVDHPSYVAQTSNCGQAVTLADVDGDGRSDLLAGCQAYSSASDYRVANYSGTPKQGGTLLTTSISDGLIDVASTTVTTTSLNQVPGRVLAVTVAGATFRNGAANPILRASANGGSTWEAVTLGAPHTFIANGTDLRVELVLPPGTGGRMTQLVHDLTVAYDVQAPADSGLMGQRVPLSIDRSNVSGSTAQWDEVQQSIRQKRAYSAGRFSTVTQLQRGTPGATQYCGWSSASGDFNDDGLADVVMGCSANNGSVLHAIAYIRSGSTYLAPVELPTPALHGGSCCGDIPDSCAYSLAVGDVNGDGRDDVVMGCPGKNGPGNDAGAAVLFLRNVANTNFDTGVIYNDPAATANDQCGYGVALGDVNQDGYADLALACPNNDTGATEAGAVVVRTWDPMGGVFGAAVVLANPTPVTDDACGISVAIGDVNGDGRGDVATGCLTDDTLGVDAGNVVVYRRNVANTGFVLEAEYTHPAGLAGDHCGENIGLSDLDGNGRADLLFSCTLDDTDVANTGTLVARWRDVANTGFTTGSVMVDDTQTASNQCGGWNGFAIGDLNGDGRSDVALGCNTRDVAGANSGGAFVHVANATGTGFVGSYEVRVPLQSANDQCGISLAIAADESGDGRGDLLFGCPADSTTASSAGSLFVLDADATMRDIANPAPGNNDACGSSIDSGDVNGDGLTDLVVGCSINNTGQGGSQTVAVYVRNAGNTAYLPAIELVHPSPATDDLCGNSVAVGDVNGDGRDDIMGGCPYDDTGGSAAGSIILWMRNAANNGFRAGVEYGHPTPSANAICGGTLNSGYAVASGDINGDGRADMVFGCAGQTVGGFANAGAVVVRTRNDANTGFNPPVVLPNPSPAANEYCGTSVGVGDLNGDGRADIASGCWGVASNAGSVAVWTSDLGGGFTAQPELAHPTAASNDNCGISIAIGDVDGNGLGDITTGCRGDTVGATTGAGGAVVFPRLALNTGFDTGVVLTHPTPTTNDGCGYAIGVGDVNGDGNDDVVLGCPLDDVTATDQGTSLTFVRDSANTNFDAGIVTTSLQPANSDQCGFGLAAADLDQDGRSDIALGCPLDDVGNSNQGSVQTSGSTATGSAGGSSRTVETKLLNVRTAGTVTTASIGYARIANGAAAPTFEASADGGTNWQTATAFLPLAFTNPGNDLRVRITLPESSNQKLVQVVHDLTIDYDYTTNVAPDAPTLVSPAAAATTTDDTPTLTARFDDSNAADTGTLSYQVCTVTVSPAQTCAGQGGTMASSGAGSAGIANGANGPWTVPTSITADTTYYWRVRATDSTGVVGPWSASRSIVVDASIIVGAPGGSIPLGSVALDSDSAGSTSITVASNDPQGYQLVATDQDASWGLQCSNVPQCGAATIPDRTAAGAAPVSWTAGDGGSAGYVGITVLDSTGVANDRLGKWGTVNPAGFAATNFTDNLFVGLGTTNTILHQVATVAPNDTVLLGARVTPTSTGTPTPAGSYSGTITVTAVGL